MGLSRIFRFLCGLGQTEDNENEKAKVILHGQSPESADLTSAVTTTKPSPIISVRSASRESISEGKKVKLPSILKSEIEPLSLPPPKVDTASAILPSSQKAFAVVSKGTYGIIDLPLPSLEKDDEIVIQTKAVGLNPIDWKSVDYNFCLPSFPWVTGREMAGVVVKIGSAVQGFRVGEKVWTSTYYKDRRAGCFQEYVAVPAHTVCHMPSNLTFESAACLGVPALTAAMTIWKWLEVPMLANSSSPNFAPPKSKNYLLVWGGSTITGQFAIQIARLHDLHVIAVTSARTASLVSSLGATVIIRDNKSGEDIVSEIRAIAGNNITRAIDVVGHSTAAFCLQALSTEKACLFAPLAFVAPEQVVESHIQVLTVEMKKFVLEKESRVWAEELNRLVQRGEIRIPEMEVLDGGLEVLGRGLDMQKRGDRGGKKIVVRFSN